MRGRKIAILVSLGVILIWEMLYYLRVINPLQFSHPFGTIEVLRHLDFLTGFGTILIYVMLTGIVGASIGLTLAAVIVYSSWLTGVTVRFLRLGLWAPFFVFWAVPYSLLPAAVMGVSLFACYRFLSVRRTFSLPWGRTIPIVQREAILQSLIFYLLFQVWLLEGWIPFTLSRQKVDIAYAIIVLLVGFISAVDFVFRSDFPSVAETQKMILEKELASGGSLWGTGLLIISCFVAWQLSADQIFRHFHVSSPSTVLKTVYPHMASGLLAFDITVSFLELLGGLTLGGGAAIVVFKIMTSNVHFSRLMFSFLPVTFVVPIMFKLVDYHWWGMHASFWGTPLAVGLITFYPFVLILWALKDYPLAYRVLLATDHSLPYAFLAMLFGETIAATKGLGFYIVAARDTYNIDESLGGSLLVFLLLLLLSSFLRTLIKGPLRMVTHERLVKSLARL